METLLKQKRNKIMKKIILTLTIGFAFTQLNAQIFFVTSAKITYEKKLNLQRKMASNTWISDDAKDKMKKYVTTLWDYSFNETTSSYKAQKQESTASENISFFGSGENTAEMYTDLAKNRRVIKKTIMTDDYILKDTIPHIDWKMEHETRKIAGYECRKAIGVINDTVYVVAFYTDEILLRGGPEGFTGLPGMILGLAIPRYNTTWFATKVDAVNVPIYEIAAPSKGKATDNERDYKKMLDLYSRYDDKKDPKWEINARKMIYGLVL